ncbi:hypothetical protein SESBI_38723 [Sesbania bispinosa]|nr:hypothetical protein SESBI_38723 [Sesbania bispinosa]
MAPNPSCSSCDFLRRTYDTALKLWLLDEIVQCGTKTLAAGTVVNVHETSVEGERNHNVPDQDPDAFGPDCVGPTPAGSSSMNLALAAERQLPGPLKEQGAGGGRAPGMSWRVLLMRLLEEGGDTTAEEGWWGMV